MSAFLGKAGRTGMFEFVSHQFGLLKLWIVHHQTNIVSQIGIICAKDFGLQRIPEFSFRVAALLNLKSIKRNSIWSDCV